MDYMALAGIIAQMASSMTGADQRSLSEAEIDELLQGAMDEYGKVSIPKLENLVARKVAPSGLSNIKDDPIYRQQQAEADGQLNDIIQSGGQTLSDRAVLNAALNRASKTAMGNDAAIQNQMQARGSLDSGAQLAMQMASNQNSAQMASDAAEKAAGDAQARSYAAMQQRSRNASEGLDRKYRQDANAASANDAINQYNAAMQSTADRYNIGIPQQNFKNTVDLIGAKHNALGDLVTWKAGKIKSDRDNASNQGAAFNAGIQAFGSGSGNNNSNNQSLSGDTTKPNSSYDGPGSANSWGNSPGDYKGPGSDGNWGQSLTGESTRQQDPTGTPQAQNRKWKVKNGIGAWYVQDFDGDWVRE